MELVMVNVLTLLAVMAIFSYCSINFARKLPLPYAILIILTTHATMIGLSIIVLWLLTNPELSKY